MPFEPSNPLSYLVSLWLYFRYGWGDTAAWAPKYDSMQVYLDGDLALKQESRRNDTAFRSEWLDSCRRATKGWAHMFWDLEKARALLSDRYPWFLPAFTAYPKTVLRGTVLCFIQTSHTSTMQGRETSRPS